MQVLVLGMHRSGTSVVTHLLSSMGCHAGGPESLKPGDSANEGGYWERWDVWALDEQVLAAAGASWEDVAALDLGSLAAADRERFEAHARELVRELDAHRPWVIKDPRLCLTSPVWRGALTAPVFVVAHRDPLEVARSLSVRDGLPLAVGIALWEVYNLSALSHSVGAPRLGVSYGRLLAEPALVAATLATSFAALGARSMRAPRARDLAEVVVGSLRRQRAGEAEVAGHLNARQAALLQALDDGTALEWVEVPAPSAGAVETLRAYGATRRELRDLRRRTVEVESRCAEAEGEVAWRRDREHDHERALESLAAKDVAQERALAGLREAIAAKEGEMERWAESVRSTLAAKDAEQERALAGLREIIAAKEGEMERWAESARATLAAKDAEQGRWVASFEETLAAAQAELGALRQRDTEISRWNESLTARLAAAEEGHREEAATLVAERDATRALLERLRKVHDETLRALAGSRELAGSLDRLVEEILRSRSWRLGRSLAALARLGRPATHGAAARHAELRTAAERLADTRAGARGGHDVEPE